MFFIDLYVSNKTILVFSFLPLVFSVESKGSYKTVLSCTAKKVILLYDDFLKGLFMRLSKVSGKLIKKKEKKKASICK